MDSVPEAPPLPLDLAVIDLKAHSGRLAHGQWFRKLSQWADRFLVVIRRASGNRHDPAVGELQYFPGIQVNISHDAFNGTRVGVAVFALIERHCTKNPLTLFVREAELARRPGIQLDILKIGDAALANGFLPGGILAHNLLQQFIILVHKARLHSLHGPPRQNLASIQVDNRLGGGVGVPFVNDYEGLPPYRCSRLVGQHFAFGRFVEHYDREAACLSHLTAALQYRDRHGYLVFSQRLERMSRSTNDTAQEKAGKV